MNLISLNLSGFRVFKRLFFEFPQEPGLYLLTGENRDRPELGSNGVGKSSLWDGVCFVLYGQSARGLKGTDLVCDGLDEIIGILVTSGGTVQRVWSAKRKNSLMLDGKEISQDELTRVLGLDREAFIATTVVPQSTPLFVDLPPTTQVSMLQKLLNIERWMEYADRAMKRGVALDKLVANVQGAYTSTKAQFDRLGSTETLQQKSRMWVEQHDKYVLEAEESYEAAYAASTGQSDRLADLQKSLAVLESPTRRAESNIKVLQRQQEQSSATRTSASGEQRVADNDLRRIHDRLSFFDTTPTCPTCEQEITDAHLEGCKEKLFNEEREVKRRLEKANSDFELATKTYQGIVTAIDETRAKLRSFEQMASVSKREIAVEEQRIAGLATNAVTLKRALDKVKNEINPHKGELIRAEYESEQLRKQTDELKVQLERDTRNAETVKVWVKGFRSIRSQLVADSLAQFGMEIAGVLEDLGLVGWQVEPVVDAAVFESARIQTGFKFQVMDPEGVSRVLDAYSGGELQRIRLAIQLGLGALISAVSGSAWQFEVWDEPSTYLSEEGIIGLFASLRARAERLEKPIWVIDHHQVHYSDVTRVYHLVRENNEATVC